MQMMTRRTALGTGLAFASIAGISGLKAYGASLARPSKPGWIDALLIDDNVEMPPQIAAFVNASKQRLPVVGIRLDAAAYSRLKRVFDASQVVMGISSGATLFCIERIAWDHGFRLTGRSQQCASDFGEGACRQDVIALLGKAHGVVGSASPLTRVYRPSRADGVLHAWAMHKSTPRPMSQDRREA